MNSRPSFIRHPRGTPLIVRSPDVRILADTHFQHPRASGERERRDRFIRFVDGIPANAELFLVGDIFDFYFEYRSVVSWHYLDIFHTIRRATTRGIPVHFLGGNHDYWVGERFANELGVTLHEVDILVETQGRRIVLAHGDLVMPRDYGYKVLKTIIRNPLVIELARWIHPDLMAALAGGVSHGSRQYLSIPQEKRARAATAHAWDHFFDRGNDAFVMGHVHYPLHEVRNGKEFVILGDWLSHFTYARLTNGRLRLETFKS
ncbi:MAG TPA: UDP-2,3-diacylglucosamine diphosphatase [Candidatus Krumholzibacteria bacterium]